MGEPTNGIVVMKQCSIKDVITTDGYRLSLVASARKGRKNKSIARLLELLQPERSRVRVESSMTHLLGERVVDLEAVNNEEVWWNLCIGLHDYLCETLGLTSATRGLRWNLHFELIVTNTEGVVIFTGPVLNWTANNIGEYLKYSKVFRRSMTAPSILNAISNSETGAN